MAWAGPDLDRKYTLESVGFLRTWDNVDGLFVEYMAKAFRDYFASQSRFRVQELQKADDVLVRAKIPYSELIQDPAVLQQISKSLRVETLLRSRVWKEGENYRITFDWIHALKNEQLATHTFVYSPEPNAKDFGGDRLKERVADELKALFRKIPFQGQVTGRDGDWVTIDLGTSALKKGDTVILSTLEDVRIHPMEKSIVEWNFAETGRAEIDQIEERIAFGKINAESPNRQISRFQKVTKILPKQDKVETPAITSQSTEEAEIEDRREAPRLGWVSGGIHMGGFTRDYTSSSGTAGFMGGGFLAGAKASSQLWLTRQFFVEGSFYYDFFGYGQRDLSTGSPSTLTSAGGMSGSASGFSLYAGYSYLATGHFFGPKAWVKLGLRSTGYTLPVAVAENLGPSSFSSILALGIGGDLPIRDRLGAVVSLDIGLFRSGGETGFSSGVPDGADDVQMFLGGYYKWDTRLALRVGVEVVANGATFSTGSTVLSMRSISFAPSLQYYF